MGARGSTRGNIACVDLLARYRSGRSLHVREQAHRSSWLRSGWCVRRIAILTARIVIQLV